VLEMQSRRWLMATLILVAAAIGARAALPELLRRYVNHVLSRDPRYEAHIGDVDMQLWKGAYEVEDVSIRKRGGNVPVPLFAAPRAEISIQWNALLDGSLVGEIELDRPAVNVVAGPTPAHQQTGAGPDWRDALEKLVPFRLNRLTVRNGSLHFRNFHTRPKVDVYLDHIDLVAENLTNSEELSETRVARVALQAVPMHAGLLLARATFDPYADLPTFDLDASLTGLQLRDWNEFLRAYAGVDVESGTLRLYAELESEKGAFHGYLKPFFESVQVFELKELDEQSFLASAWETVVGALTEAFEDHSHDRVASRIPLGGSVRSPEIGFWGTLGSTLRNAFIESLVPRLEQSVGEQ